MSRGMPYRLPYVHPGVPDDRHEVALLQLQGACHVVQRQDHSARGVGGELVYVHDAQVGTLPALDGRRHLLVVGHPLQVFMLTFMFFS